MLTYHVAYFEDSDGVHVHAMDFPGVVSCGRDLEEARLMVQSALVDMVEYLLEQGKPLPQPNPQASEPDADLEEPLYLLLEAASQVQVVRGQVSA